VGPSDTRVAVEPALVDEQFEEVMTSTLPERGRTG
jgi:hypothetical protein